MPITMDMKLMASITHFYIVSWYEFNLNGNNWGNMVAAVIEPPGADPYARWCGAGGL